MEARRRQGYNLAFGEKSRGIEKGKAAILWLGLGDVSAAKCCCSLEQKEEDSSEALPTHIMCELKEKWTVV